MRYLQKILFIASIVLFIFVGIMLTNCEIALGSTVSTGSPKIGDSDNVNPPGSYLQGAENIIWFDVEQESGIDNVYMEVEYRDLNTGEQKRKTIMLDNAGGKWFVNLDTTDMEDGKITAWVTATDVFGNKTTTTGINYIVKNLPPQIEMTIPSIKGEDFDNTVFLDSLGENDPLFVGFDLMGLASDNFGISLGWPKIMFWPADEKDVDSDGLPINPKYKTWRTMVVPVGTRDGVTATRITWPMVYLVEDPSAEGGWRLPKGGEHKTNLMEGRYRFRIEAKDLFGNVNCYPPEKDNRKKYIEINYTVSDIPIARITDAPQFYNGVGDFTAMATVIASKSPLKKVVVFVAKNQDGTGFSEKITLYNADTDPPLDPSTENGKTYNLNITLTKGDVKWSELQTDSGDLYLHIVATDDSEKDSPTSYRNFIFDTVAPAVLFDRPDNLTGVIPYGNLKGGLEGTSIQYEIYRPSASPKWVSGMITIGGVTNDLSDIYEILYHVGDLGDDKAAAGGKETTVSKDKLEDIYKNAQWKDTGLGITNNPKDGWSGSRNFWSYTYNFNNDRDKGQAAGDFGFPDSNGALGIEDDVSGTVNRQRFYLPFYVKVSDRAGNVKIVHYKLAIDPVLDIPQVDITYPPQNSLLGGVIRLSGVARDNYRIDKVLIRIKKEGMSGYYIPDGAAPFYNSSTIPIFPKPKANGKDDTDGWFEAEITGSGMEVYWSYNINGDGRLDPDGGKVTAGVSIEVRAIDVSTTNATGERVGPYISPAETLNIIFSAGIPTISAPKIIDIVSGSGGRDYDAGGTRTSGTVKISMIVKGADPGFSLIRTRINGSGPNLPIGNPVNQPATGEVPPEWKWKITRLPDDTSNSRPVRYELEIEIDTLMYAGFGQTEAIRLEVTTEDTGLGASKQGKTEIFTIEADNFYPFVERIDTHSIAVGADFDLSGVARDYIGTASIQGLERMLIYFEDAKISYANNVRTVVGTGKFFGPQRQDITSTMTTYRVLSLAAATTEDYQNASSASIVNKPFPAYSMSGGVWRFPNAIVIDKELAGNAQIWSSSAIKNWQATMDTTKFTDGPLMIHYVIMDEAGNATHYQKPVYIENNKPRILSINMGTDINGDGTVTPWTNTSNPGEYRNNATTVATTTGYDEDHNKRIAHNPAFRVRNKRLAFDISTAFGNDQKYYRVSYVSEGSVISASEMRIGGVYRIVTPGNTPWRQCGAQLTERDTTFVASGRDEKNGGGTVRVLNEVVPNVKSGAFSGNSHTITITDFTGISDSGLNTSNDIEVPNDKLFIIKVYDSAVSSDKITGASDRFEENQLAHAILVAMNLDNADRKAPMIEAAPFGQKFVVDSGQSYQNDANKKLGSIGTYNENIVMSGTIKQGYVQYAGNSGTPDISGQVKFLGRAEDNQRIKEITVTISNFNGGNAFTVAKEGSNGLLESIRSQTTGIGTGNNAWYFNIIEQHLTLDYGHVLNWEFAWDSSEITNQVGTATVSFRVNDCKTGTPNSGQSSLSVNIAPYIAEVVTDLSGAYASAPSAFARSANGWYPVREGRDITIRGFNLGGIGNITTSSNSKVTLSDGTTTTNLTGAVSANAAGETVGKNKIVVNTGTVATSGALVVTVNGVASLNNRNNNSEPYNREPNGVNNNNLTDDRNLYVWTTGSMVPHAVMTGPFMRMGADAKRYISYGYYAATGIFRLQKDNATNVVETGTNINRYLNSTVSFDSYGDWYTAASNMTVGSYNMNIFARDVTDNGNTANAGHNNRRVLSPMTIDGQTDMDRYKIPRIAVQHTNGASQGIDGKANRIYVSYGDSLSANYPVVFHMGTRGSNGTAHWGGNFPTANGLTPATRQIVASDDTAFKYAGSIYTAVASLSSGMPVIAWYDRKTPRLVFSWGRNPVTGTAYGDLTDTNVQSSGTSTTECNTTSTSNANYNYWQANAVVVDTGKGSHVDMAIDGHNNIHLAYYDSDNGGLYYALIPSDNGTTALGGTVKPNPGAGNANIKKVKVDTFLAVGTKLMLNVRNEGTTANPVYVPYISYFHGAFTETPNSIRVAWLKNSPIKGAATGVIILPGSDDNDHLTGNWELMTVPAETIPVSGEFICNGVPGVAGTNVAPNITMTDPSSTAGAGTLNSRGTYMNKSILIAYKTDTYYEGAVLKADLTKVLRD